MLKNFTVVELLRTRSDSVVTIKKNTLRFNNPTAAELHYTPFIQVLINTKDKQIAIRECKETDQNSIKFSKPQGEQKYQLSVTCPSAVDMARKLMNWDEEEVWNVPGIYLAEDKAVLYDLKCAYPPVKKGGWASHYANEEALSKAVSSISGDGNATEDESSNS